MKEVTKRHIKQLYSTNKYDRSNSAWALGIIAASNEDVSEAKTGLINLLADEHDFARSSAAWALKQMAVNKVDISDARSALINSLSDSFNLVRDSAAWALGFMANNKEDLSSARSGLVKLLRDSFDKARANAAWALGAMARNKQDISEAKSELIILLSDPYQYVRSNAAFALGSMVSNKQDISGAKPGLISLLADSYDFVRGNAAFVLGSMGFNKQDISGAKSELINLLWDSSYTVRSNAALAIAGMAFNQEDISIAKDRLINLIVQYHDNSRKNAASALKIAADNVKPIPELTPIINSADLKISSYACWALLSIHSNSYPINKIPKILDLQSQDPEVEQLLEGKTAEERLIFDCILCKETELKTIISALLRHSGLVSDNRSYKDKFYSSCFSVKKLSRGLALELELCVHLIPEIMRSLENGIFTDVEAYMLERIVLSEHYVGDILSVLLDFISNRDERLINSIEKAINVFANISESKSNVYIKSFSSVLEENIKIDFLKLGSRAALFKIYKHLDRRLRSLADEQRVEQIDFTGLELESNLRTVRKNRISIN